MGRKQVHLDAPHNTCPTNTERIWRSLETGARFSKVPVINQIFISSYKESSARVFLRNQSILFIECKTIETPILHVNNKRFPESFFSGNFEKRAPDLKIEVLAAQPRRLLWRRLTNLDFCPWSKLIQTMQKHLSLKKGKNKQNWNNNLTNS